MSNLTEQDADKAAWDNLWAALDVFNKLRMAEGLEPAYLNELTNMGAPVKAPEGLGS